ncbi:MAG: hypothetical protein WCK05_07690, partial [Planctomycetota bacterium]
MKSSIKIMSPATLPRRLFVWLLGAGLLSAALACSPGGPPLAHLHEAGAPFREVGVDLSPYQSVQQRAGQDPAAGMALACSGGGMRAANLVAGVLLGLEELKKEPGSNANAPREVDYFSSVSGGGMGVGA